MKAHIGVDAESGLAHSLATTAANAADVTQACVLLHGDETEAWGDAGYQGVDKRPENRGCDGGLSAHRPVRPPTSTYGRLGGRIWPARAKIRRLDRFVDPAMLVVGHSPADGWGGGIPRARRLSAEGAVGQ